MFFTQNSLGKTRKVCGTRVEPKYVEQEQKNDRTIKGYR